MAEAQGLVDYNVLQNNGAIAHQAVFHVHVHVIPKPDISEGLFGVARVLSNMPPVVQVDAFLLWSLGWRGCSCLRFLARPWSPPKCARKTRVSMSGIFRRA